MCYDFGGETIIYIAIHKGAQDERVALRIRPSLNKTSVRVKQIPNKNKQVNHQPNQKRVLELFIYKNWHSLVTYQQKDSEPDGDHVFPHPIHLKPHALFLRIHAGACNFARLHHKSLGSISPSSRCFTGAGAGGGAGAGAGAATTCSLESRH